MKPTLLKRIAAVAVAASALATTHNALAQRTGDSARVTVGIVERAQQVELQSNAGRNALLSGAVGWAIARNQSSQRQAAAALGGAALGGAATSRAEGDNRATQYTVRSIGGSVITVITDQSEIRIGDCVVVEEVGDNANIRRKDPATCQQQSEPVRAAVEPELQQDADQCAQAKQRLFAATTPEEVEVARQVMEILCND